MMLPAHLCFPFDICRADMVQMGGHNVWLVDERRVGVCFLLSISRRFHLAQHSRQTWGQQFRKACHSCCMYVILVTYGVATAWERGQWFLPCVLARGTRGLWHMCSNGGNLALLYCVVDQSSKYYYLRTL